MYRILLLVIFVVSVQVIMKNCGAAQDDTTAHSACSADQTNDGDENSMCTSAGNEETPKLVDTTSDIASKDNRSTFKGKPGVIKPSPLGGGLRENSQTIRQSPTPSLGDSQPNLDQLSKLMNMVNMFGPMLSSMQQDKNRLDKHTQAKFDMMMNFLPLHPQIQQLLSNPTASNSFLQILGGLMSTKSMPAATGRSQCPKPTWKTVLLKTTSKPLVEKSDKQGHTADKQAYKEGKKPASYPEFFSILASSLGLGNGA